MTLALLAPLSASASVSLGEANLNALSNGLVGYWPLDGGTTNWNTDTINDVTGNGSTGTLNSFSTSTSPIIGKIGGALNFNGTNGWVNFGTPTILQPSVVTFSIWIKPATTSFNWDFIAGSSGASGWSGGYHFDTEAAGPVEFCVNGYTGSGACATLGSTSLTPAGAWTSLVGVYNGSTVTLYLNGVRYIQTSYSTPISYASQTFRFGGGGGAVAYYSGGLDDVRVYNRALSAQEVQMLYETGTFDLGVTPAINSSFSIDQGGLNGGLVAYWPLDGNTTNWATGVTNDVSGNAANANLTGFSTTTSPVPGKIGQALAFNGSTSYITTGYTIPAQSSATSFTWSTWMKLNASGGTIVIMGFRNGATWVKLTPSAFEYSAGSIISHTIPTGQWVLITIVKNGTNFTYYQNGAVIGTASNSSSVVSHVMYLGEDPGFGGDGILNGDLDDVRVYNRALSQQEVQQLYSAGQVNIGHSNTSTTTGLNSGLVAYWTFDGPTVNWASGLVSDTSGNGDGGQIESMSTSSTPTIGKIGQAFSYNGSSSYVSLPSATFNFPTSGNTSSYPSTFVAWFKTTSDGVILGQTSAIVPPSVPGGFVPALYVDTSGKLRASIFWHNDTTDQIVSSAVVNNGKWHQAVDTYSNGVETLYIDGVAVGSQTMNEYSYTTTYTYFLGTGYWNSWPSAGSGWGYFNGSIDNVRVYNRALSPQEIAQLYASGQ